MVSLIRADDNDIAFAYHVHRSITIHKEKLSLKYCYYTLEVELRSWQPSVLLNCEQPYGKTVAALG